MYLIVGLGNPESDYSKTRHNMGFNVINKLSEKYGIEVNKSKFKGLVGNGIIEGEKVVLLKPQTFMNLSGESVIEAMNFYKIPKENLIIIYDDVDIEPGNIRIRKNGSAGTHNGMKDVVQKLSSNDIPRLRIGTGGLKKEKEEIISFVLSKFSKDQINKLDEIFYNAYIKFKDFLDK